MKFSNVILVALVGLALASSVAADSLVSLKKHMHKKSQSKTQHKLSEDADKPKLKKVKVIGEDVPVAGSSEVVKAEPKFSVAVIGDDATIAAQAAASIPGCDCDTRAAGAIDVPTDYVQPEMKPCICGEPSEDDLYEARKSAKGGFAPMLHNGIVPEYREDLQSVEDLQMGIEAEAPVEAAIEVPAVEETFDHVVPEFKPEVTPSPEEILAANTPVPLDPMVVFEASKIALPVVPQMKGEPLPPVETSPVTVDEVAELEVPEAVQQQLDEQLVAESEVTESQ